MGTLINSIYGTSVVEIDSKEMITIKIRKINKTPDTPQNVIDSFKVRTRLCIEKNGGHITHLPHLY